MPKDLKTYIKTAEKLNKNNQTSQNDNVDIANLANKSPQELQSDFETALLQSKQNGTFNKTEMLSMLLQIQNNMQKGEYERVRAMIERL